MIRLLVLSSILTLGNAATAQITATFIAKTKMSALAYWPSTGAKIASIPINTDLTGSDRR